jgi:putative membrane protein
MSGRWILAALHLLSLGIGLGAIWVRARVLRGPLDLAAIRTALNAHAWWGVAGHLWIVTGVLRLFTGLEKGSAYYLHNYLFHTKMGLLVLVLVLEVGPLLTLRRWRKQLARGETPETATAMRFATTSMAQAVLVVLMVFAAAGMARGYGMR